MGFAPWLHSSTSTKYRLLEVPGTGNHSMRALRTSMCNGGLTAVTVGVGSCVGTFGNAVGDGLGASGGITVVVMVDIAIGGGGSGAAVGGTGVLVDGNGLCVAVGGNGGAVESSAVYVGGSSVLVVVGVAIAVAMALGVRACPITGGVLSLTRGAVAMTFAVAARAVRVAAALLPPGESPYAADPPRQRQRSRTTLAEALPIMRRRLLRGFFGGAVVGSGAVVSSAKLMLHPPFTVPPRHYASPTTAAHAPKPRGRRAVPPWPVPASLARPARAPGPLRTAGVTTPTLPLRHVAAVHRARFPGGRSAPLAW